MTDKTLRVLVLGAGSTAHVLAGVLSSHRHVDARVMTWSRDEAKRWTEQMNTVGFDVVFRNWEARKEKHFVSKPTKVSNNVAEVAQGCNVFIFTDPPSKFGHYFRAIKPYIQPGAVVIGMPGGCSFYFHAKGILSDHLQQCVLINFSDNPWTCHINKFGFGVTVSSAISATYVSTSWAVASNVLGPDAVKTFSDLLYGRPSLIAKGNILADSLTNLNAILHPSIMYGQWSTWTGTPLERAPPFYHGINEIAAELATGISAECVSVAKTIQRLKPNLDLSRVVHINDLYAACRLDGVDNGDILSQVTNDWNNAGVTHPMTQIASGQFVPDFACGYLFEDVPHGLLVMRGVAEIVGIQTPYMDEVIEWAEGRMTKEYILHDKMLGKDVQDTGCPQRYGLKTLDAIL